MEATYEPIKGERVLAIDPMSRGFGFVVLEQKPLQLVDWGIRTCLRGKKESCPRAVRRMLKRYKPTVIVTEDAREARSLRAIALGVFLADIDEVLSETGIRLRTYSRREIREAFAGTGAVTKPQIAAILAGRFPELRSKVPPERQVWESEDSRMSIFDALSFAATHLASGDG